MEEDDSEGDSRNGEGDSSGDGDGEAPAVDLLSPSNISCMAPA